MLLPTRAAHRRLTATALLCSVAIAPPLASQQPEIATTVAFTEGPTVDRDGNVYFTDIINQRIMKLGADGVLSTYREKSNAANGLLVDSWMCAISGRAEQFGMIQYFKDCK